MAPPKKKAEKMSLGDFLGDQTLGSWADEMEDLPLGSGTGGGGGGAYKAGGGGAFGGSGGGFGPSGGGFARDALPLPTKPPFTAHLGNLSFDATEGDIGDFFGECQVTNVRIVEDKLEMKPKGFGYVEFGSLDGLKKALELSGTQFQGRNIRVSVAEPPKDRADQKDMSDWTRKGPLPDLPGAGRRVSERGGFGDRSAGGGFGDRSAGGGFGGDRAGGFERGRNFEPAGSDAGSERGERRRPPPFEGDGKVRDFGNWERKGPLSPVPGAAPPSRDGGRTRTYDGPREQRQSPAAGWGEGRAGAPAEGGSQDGSRPPRREFQDRPQYDRQPTAPELDNQWRTKMRPDAVAKSPTSTPDASTPSSPAPQPAAPAGRPKLNLAKRTVSEAVPAPLTSASESKSNPFGAARPIDTATREKEIEEKREFAIREKKEADDKAREEKRAKDTADRAARASVPPTPTTDAHHDEDSEEKSAASYEILQRGEDDAGNGEEAAAVDASANGEIVEDKAVKPQEVVRDPPKAEGAGAWRRKGAPAAEPAESTTETVEDDGWSTVTKPKATKSTRGGPPARGGRGGPPARAIAS